MEILLLLILLFLGLWIYAASQSKKFKSTSSKLEVLLKKTQDAHQKQLDELKQIHLSLNDEIGFAKEREAYLNKDIESLKQQHLILSNRILELSKFEGVLDVERKAEQHKLLVIRESHNLIVNIRAKIFSLNDQIKKVTKEIQDNAIANAKQIAGEAYALKDQEKEIRKVITALENKIYGYGDQYLIPVSATLDDLIEQYGHLDAANKLALVKQKIKDAIRNNRVADCDYAEPYRRSTAIAFVIDAFNGKAASNLARIKHDNVGKLIQSLRDDFVLVNNNGKAFRNAHIKDSYLQLRIEELQWASIVLEYREREREEQRAIREQIREEERARKEYERAIKDAEKEEAMLLKAYEKAKKEYEKASDNDKAKYENFIKELNEKLRLAEEKNQRALSMAQQTKAGHVYIISNIGSFGENVLKLGMTRRLEPLDRVRELGDASVPFPFDVHAMIYSENAPQLENELHKFFNHYRVNKVNYRKEFFNVSIGDVKKFLESKNIQARFTLKAEAAQYRESLAIEALPDDEQRILEDKLEMVLATNDSEDNDELNE